MLLIGVVGVPAELAKFVVLLMMSLIRTPF